MAKTKIRVMDCLRASRTQLCAKDIATRLGITQNAVNSSLRILLENKLVVAEVRGARNKWYSIASGAEPEPQEDVVPGQPRIIRLEHRRMQPKDEPLRKQQPGGGRSSVV